MVVKASTKPWPRRLGSSIIRALPPLSQSGRGGESGLFPAHAVLPAHAMLPAHALLPAHAMRPARAMLSADAMPRCSLRPRRAAAVPRCRPLCLCCLPSALPTSLTAAVSAARTSAAALTAPGGAEWTQLRTRTWSTRGRRRAREPSCVYQSTGAPRLPPRRAWHAVCSVSARHAA